MRSDHVRERLRLPELVLKLVSVVLCFFPDIVQAGPQSAGFNPIFCDAVVERLEDWGAQETLSEALPFSTSERSSDVLIECLMDCLDLEHANVRDLAILALGRLGDRSVGAIPRLLGLLTSEDLHARVVLAVVSIGPARSEKAILAALDNSSSLVRHGACWVIQLSSEKIVSALPRLGELLLHDPDLRVRAIAAEAIGSFKHGNYGLLLRALEDESAIVRAAAVEAIGMSGELDKLTEEVLRERLHSDPNLFVRVAIESVIGDYSWSRKATLKEVFELDGK